MRTNNLAMGIVSISIGVIGLIIGSLNGNRLSDFFYVLAGAGIASGTVELLKYFYWNRPENKERYQMKLENEQIELHDERKEKLRDKSGRYTYIMGLIVIIVSIVSFQILEDLEIIPDTRIAVIYLGGYFFFQIIAGKIMFKYLSKKY